MDKAAASLRQQWIEPSDIFSILLILGGDVIRMALAAVSGSPLTPVSFSFGWVSYAISALLSSAGENRLMPTSPELLLRVINLETGYVRFNRSWTLGRLFQHFEFWMPVEVKEKIRHPVLYRDEEDGEKVPSVSPSSAVDTRKFVSDKEAHLCVSVYQWADDKKHMVGRPGHDWVWWLGLLVTIVQLGISAIPFGLYKDWSILLVTAAGTTLAYATGTLPQWRKEKWACRFEAKKDIALTLGNGTQHVIIIRKSKSTGLDLEDLAGGQLVQDDHHHHASGRHKRRFQDVLGSNNATRGATFVLALLWLLLLVTSTGIHDHSWYLLAIGGLGMLQNLISAGAPRPPAMLGIPIELDKRPEDTDTRDEQDFIPVFAEFKVMHTLMELEMAYPGFGRQLRSEFFPGVIEGWEDEWWNASDKQKRKELLRAAKGREFTKQMKKLAEKKSTSSKQ